MTKQYTATIAGVTYTDADAAKAAVKAHAASLKAQAVDAGSGAGTAQRKAIAARADFTPALPAPAAKPRGWKRPPAKPFDPSLGEVGSWVKLPNGTVGQVWSIVRGGKDPSVIVADGTTYHGARYGGNGSVLPVEKHDGIRVADLEPAMDPAEQIEIPVGVPWEPTDEPTEPLTITLTEHGKAKLAAFEASRKAPERFDVCESCGKLLLANEAHVRADGTSWHEQCHAATFLAEHVKVIPVGFPAERQAPEPAAEAPKRPGKLERKAWNRALGDAARKAGRDTYRAAMARWDELSELRNQGVSVEDALATLA